MITLKKQFKKIALLGVTLLGFQSMQAQLSGSYTIDKNTATGGTNFASFKDFESALYANGVSAAVTVQVVANTGPYSEQVTFRAPVSNAPTATKPVVVYGNGNTITYTASSSSSMYTVALKGIDYLTLSNLNVIAAATTYCWGIWFTSQADYNTIDSCKVTAPNSTSTSSTYGAGIVFSASSSSPTSGSNNGFYNNIKNSLIKGSASGGFYYGICEYMSSYTTTSANTYTNNDISDFYYYGIYTYYTLGNKYIGNKIHRTTKTTVGTGYGFYNYYCADAEYIGNSIYDMFKNNPTSTSTFYGIYSPYNYGYGTTKYINNAIYNNDHDGYFSGIYAYYHPYATEVQILHNTIQHSGTTNGSSAYQGYYGINCYSSGNKLTMLNNMLDITHKSSSGYFYGLYYGISNQSAVTIDNNLTNFNIVSSSLSTKYYAYNAYYSYQYSALSDFQNAGFQLNGVDGIPKYLDKANGNLGLASINFDNKGKSGTGVTTDINGKTRNSSTPDVGAFELDIDLKVTSVSVANATLCQYKTQAVTVQIKNGSTFPLEDPTVEYRVDAGGTPVAEVYKGTILPGATVSYQFTKLVEMPGGSHTLYGYVQTRFGEAVTSALKGGLAPTGSDFVKGSGFIGTFNSGNPGDPDVVANPDKLVYELKAPTGYTNGKYGTDWAIATLDFVELVGGAGVPSSDTVTKKPGAAPGTLTFTPSKAITDKTYKISYTIYSYTTGCDAPVISREVLVAPRPVVDYNIAPTCGGQKSKFEGASTITSGTYSVMWYFGDGGTSDYVNPEHLYTASGTYQAKLVVTSNRGYKDSITKTVGVYDNPVANFTYNNTCDMKPATFKATSTSPNAGKIVNTFDFGDGTSATGDNLTHTYGTFGEFSVTLTTTDAVGCVTKVTKNFTHTEKPNASFTINNGALICSQSTSSFTNTSTNVSGVGYEWNFGDGSTSVTSNASHQYATDGKFDVKLIARSEAGCEETTTKTITVQKGADIKFGYNGNCNGQLVTFTNTTVDPAGTSYSWNFGDGSTSTDRAAVHQYGATGNFDVVVTAITGAGCVTSSTQSIVVGEKPVAFFSTSKESACTGDNIDINNGSYASSSTLTYAWDLGNGTTSTDAAPSVSYANAGTFVIQLITKAGACADTATQSIMVTKTPDATFTQASEGLGLGGIVFTPNTGSGSGTYVWTLGDGTIKKDKASFTYRYAPTGYFRACLERNDNGCFSSTCQDITINTSSVARATENGLSIYPNPSKGVFTLMPVNGNIGMSAVSVINAVGQTILNVNVDLTGGYNMNLDNVAPGIYTVNVISGNTQYNQKVTIVK